MTTDHTSTPTGPLVPGAGTIAVLALGWLLASLSAARITLGAAPEASELVVTQAALALPAVFSASLLAGAAVALAARSLAARRIPAVATRTAWSLGLCAAAGGVVGVVTATPAALAYRHLPSAMVLCGAIAVAAVLGGLVAGVRVPGVVAAGACGALGVFVVGFAVAIFEGDLLSLFGAGATAESKLAANGWVALVASLVAGLAAGTLSYAYLRRSGQAGQRWPVYLVAGATPGLLVLLAEVITRLAGARLFQLVSAASADDQVVLNYLNPARFNRAMIVLFVGALVAIFLLGRTLKAGAEEPHTADPAQAATSRASSETSYQASS